MIRLTKPNGKPLYISAEHITAVESVWNKGEEQTWLYTVETADPAIVVESPEEVVRKVLEYRLAMEDYRIFIQGATVDGDYNLTDGLFELAGLEE